MSDKTPPSPRITSLSWGQLQVEGAGTFKDARLYPGGARAWDWNETGTSHRPGIQPADVAGLVEKGAVTVILSRGMNERLQVMNETLAFLKEHGITVHVLQTEAAVETYNRLRESEPVAALIHSTC